MDDDYVELEATSSPHFGRAEPHPSSPAGQVAMAGNIARRVGAKPIRIVLAGLFVLTLIALAAELF